MMENAVVSIRRIREIAVLEPENDTGADGVVVTPSNPDKEIEKKRQWPYHGSLVFQDVSLRYR